MSQANSSCPVCQAQLTSQDLEAARCPACGTPLPVGAGVPKSDGRETVDENRMPADSDSVDEIDRATDTVDEAALTGAPPQTGEDVRQTIDESAGQSSADTHQTLDESQLAEAAARQTVDEGQFSAADARQTIDESSGNIHQTVDESQLGAGVGGQTIDESQFGVPGGQTIDESQLAFPGGQTIDESALQGGDPRQTIDEAAHHDDSMRTLDEASLTVDEGAGVAVGTEQGEGADKQTVDDRDVMRTVDISQTDESETGTVDDVRQTLDEQSLAAQKDKGTGTVHDRAISQTIDMSESPAGAPQDKGSGTVDERSVSQTMGEEALIPLAGALLDEEGTVASRSVARTIDSAELSPEAADRIRATWQGVTGAGVTPMTSIKREMSSEPGGGSALVIHARRFASAKDKNVRDADYGILRLLGEGGMGMVYAARQASIDRTVAVKTLKPDTAKDRQQRDKFLSEAVVTGDLEHPNIVPIYDVGMRDDGSLFYSMKRVQGTPWMDVIHKKSLHENLEILMKVADAVAFSHDKRVVHRDLKPENVMLGGYGEVLVMDWGLALPSDGRRMGGIKQSLSMGGTPAYMAPEMAAGPFERIGYGSDIYLLGAMLYEIITGRPPHTGEDVMKCLFAAARNQIQSTEKSGELLDIALKAMSSKPEDRHASVSEFQQAIREYMSHSESVALSTRASEDLEQAGKSDEYQDYAKALFGFEEAYSLWSGNDRAKRGISETALAYAGAAKRKGDFDLGVSLLKSNDPTHGKLLVELKESIKERDARQRRLKTARRIMAGLIALVFVVITGASIYSYSQYQVALAAEAKATASAKLAKKEADNARIAEGIATVEAENARNAQADALAQKTKAEAQTVIAEAARTDAVAAQAIAVQREREAIAERNEAEYRAYVAQIGLAAAKIEENAFDAARDLLNTCNLALRDWEWGRLMHLCQQQSTTVAAANQIETLAIHWDEDNNRRRIVTGGRNGTVQIWNVPQLFAAGEENAIEQIVALEGFGETSFVYAAAFSPDGKLLATGGDEKDMYVRLWNAETGEEQPTTFSGHENAVTSVEFSADGKLLLTSSYDRTARLWNVGTGAQVGKPYVGHDNWVWDASFAPPVPDARGLLRHEKIVTASQDGTAIVWDVSSGEKSPPFRGHSGPIYSASYSHDGQRIVTGGYDKRVLVWRPDEVREFEFEKLIAGQAVTPPKFAPFDGHTAAVRSASFSTDDKLIVSCGQDNTVRIWNVDAGRLHKAIRGHGRSVQSCVFTPDSNWVLSGSYDQQIKLWNIEGYNESTVLEGHALRGHADAVLGVDFSDDGSQIVTASRDRSARVWNTASGDPVQDLIEGHAFLATSVAYFPDGIHVATGAFDNTVRIWDVTKGTESRLLEGTGRSAALAISPDGKWILTGSNENAARLWSAAAALTPIMPDAENADAADLEPEFSFVGHENEVSAVAFSRDSRLCATCDADGRCKVWDVNERKLLHDFSQSGRVVAAAFSPDAGLLLAASGPSVLQYNLAENRLEPQLSLKHSAGVTAMALSPNGETVLSASLDGAVWQWDARRAAVVRTLNHELINPSETKEAEEAADDNQTQNEETVTNVVSAVAFSNDGRYAITVASQDGSVRMWQWDEGMKSFAEEKSPGGAAPRDAFLDFNTLRGVVWSAAFSHEGNQVLTVGGNVARLWDAAPLAIDDRRELMTFSPHGVVASASFSADGTKIVTASWDNSARIWDARTGNDILKLERKHTKAVNRAVFHPTADRVLTASADGTAIVWEIDWENKTAKDIVTLTGHAGGVNDAVFSRDGTRILTASMDKTARIWNAESGVELAQLDDTAAPNPEAPVDPAKPAEPTGHRWAVLRAAFSDDGQYVITGSADDSAKIWFVGGTIQRAGAEVTFDEINMTLTGAGEPAEKNAQIIARMEQAQKLPELDDGQLATLTEAGAATGVIRILKRGRVIRMLYTLSGHTADVTSVAFTPELGTRVLTGSEDYTAKVWDAENGQEILTLKGHSQEVTSVAFSRDGVYALTGSGDGTAIIWLATSEGWQQGGIAPAEPEVRNASLDAGRATGKITSLSQP